MTVTDGFEDGVADWPPDSCTFTQDATHVNSGDWAAKMVVTGSPTQAFARKRVQAKPGFEYTATIWAFATGSTTNVAVTIDWTDANGDFISSDATTVTLTANTWTEISVTATAPALTDHAGYGPTLGSSPATGKTIWVDDTEFDGPGITAVQDSAWPPRIIVAATGLTIGQLVTIYRIQDGVRSAAGIRDADGVTVTDTALVVPDGEYSFGVPTVYSLSINGTDDVATSDSFTPTLPGGHVALSDAITGLSVETIITAWPDRTADRGATLYNVGGRTIVVSPPRGGFRSSVELLTDNDVARQQMIALLQSATSGILLIRSPDASTYPGYDQHLAILSDDERIWIQKGSDTRRLWTIDVASSTGWPSTLQAVGSTYQQVIDAYDGLTYADLAGDFATYFDMEVFDWSAGV